MESRPLQATLSSAQGWRRIADRPAARWMVVLGSALAVAAALATPAGRVALVLDWQADDAFIIYRYAANLVDSGRIVWNLGEPPVEGYTTFLLVLLSALPVALGLDVERFIEIVGGGLLLIAIAACAGRARRAGWVNLAGGAVLLLYLALAAEFPIHFASGMETTVYAAILLLLLVRFFAACDAGRADDAKAAARGLGEVAWLGLLLGLTRPEGAVIGAGLTLLLLWCEIARGRWRATWPAAPALAVGAIYVAWRLYAFGHLFPIPFHIKIGEGFGIPGLRSTGGFVALHLGALALALLIAFRAMREDPVKSLGLVGVLGFTLALALATYGIMNFAHRFEFPLLVIALAAAALPSRAEWAARTGHVVIIALTLPFFAGAQASLWRDIGPAAADYGANLCRTHGMLAELFRRSLPPDARLAVSDAGTVPYFTRLPTIDVFGLNDNFIGRSNPSLEARTRYVVDRKPAVMVATSFKADLSIYQYRYEPPLLAALSTELGFETLGVFEFKRDSAYVVVAAAPAHIASLRANLPAAEQWALARCRSPLQP